MAVVDGRARPAARALPQAWGRGGVGLSFPRTYVDVASLSSIPDSALSHISPTELRIIASIRHVRVALGQLSPTAAYNVI